MAQPFSTGAVHLFWAFSGTGKTPATPKYLGTCESMPQDTRQPEYEPVMNDYSGSKVPLDFAFEGISSQISMVLTRWDEAVYQIIIGGFTIPNVAGTWTANDVGTLMSLEGRTQTIWMVYTFGATLANKAAYVGAGLPAGRRYPQCILWAPETEEQGTKPMKRHLMFYAWPQLNTSTRVFTLFDYNMTGITANAIV